MERPIHPIAPRPIGSERSPIADRLTAEISRLATSHRAAGGGREHSENLSIATDNAISAIFAEVDPRGWAVAAVGGYGRRQLSPKSDVDVVFLCVRRDDSSQRLANSLFYALWDAGLDSSPSVRTPAESVELASEDLATLTALLSMRFVTGDHDVFVDTSRRLLVEARRKQGRPLSHRLLHERETRLARAAEALYGLEPNLKDGRGGLRDLHEVLWAAEAAIGSGDLSELERLGYLGQGEAAEVSSALDYLLKVRNRLHYLTGRRTDRLHFAYQADVAAFLGYGGSSEPGPVVAMMRDLHARADCLARAADGFWEHLSDLGQPASAGLVGRIGSKLRLNGSANGDDRLPAERAGRLPMPEALPSEPAALLAVLADAGRRGVRVGHDFVRQAKLALATRGEPVTWSGEMVGHFLDVLRAGDTAAQLVEAASASGLLSAIIPEWEAVRYLAHQDIYHLHTVDHHSALVVAEISRLRTGTSDADPFTLGIADEVRDYEPLLLAALLHDVGKGASGDHSEAGAAIVERLSARVWFGPSLAGDAEFLVRYHLLLARSATRRDLEDPDLITQLATTIGTSDRLRMLYLLTFADSIQTGPSAWTDWKAALVRDLTLRLMAVLADSNGRPAHNLEDRVVARVAELRHALAGDVDHERLDVFLTDMPAAYVLSQTPDQVATHLKALDDGDQDVAHTIWARRPDGLHDELTVITKDRPGLLWRLCGVFALHGVSILEARVHTGRDGTAIDVFRLDDAFEPEISIAKQERIGKDLEAVLGGRLSLGYRLARKLSSYRTQQAGPTVASSVAVDNAVSRRYTLVEVRAQDRLGLLYSIARAMSELQLDIHIAKLATRASEAIDIFYVRDSQGQKATDPEFVKEIERAILFEVESIS